MRHESPGSVSINVLGTKVPPLEAIHGSQIPFTTVSKPYVLKEGFRAIPIPDLDALFREESRICRSSYEQKLLDDAAEEGAFGGEERKYRRLEGSGVLVVRRGRECLSLCGLDAERLYRGRPMRY
jgi:hypothetical protein